MRDADSYTAIDLETTGFDPKRERIIEIGAVRVINGTVQDSLSMLIHPGRKLEPRIEELTGITDEMLQDAPEIGDEIGGILEFCGDLPLLGHNILFDYSFLKRAAVNCGLPFEKNGIDTLRLCRLFMPEEEKKNLTAACAYYGVSQEGAHRAMADAVSAHLLYQALRADRFEENPGAFEAKPLIYKVKREQPASKKQKQVLRDLEKYHRISLNAEVDSLTRNEASRLTDRIISQYGRIVKR